MILLFHGDNTYAARAKIRELAERYKSKSGDFGLERFWGGDPDITAENIVASITSVPFLAPSRLVIIEDLLKNKPVAEKVLPALERVPDSTVVVFYEPEEADKRTKLFKQLQKIAKPAEFKNLNTVQLKNWVLKIAKELGAELDGQSAQHLIEYVGEDQWRLGNEIEKLAHAGKPINKELIEDLVQPTFGQTIFNLTDSLSRGQAAQALKLYEGLRAGRAQPIYIVAMIGWQLRNLLLVGAAGKPPAAVAKEAGMSPFVASKAAQLGANLDLDSLKRAYNAIANLDYQLKTASVQDDALVEDAIYRVSSLLVGARAPISSGA